MIITCGFVSSGTRLLNTVVDYHMGIPALHRSWPHWDRFWKPTDFGDSTWIVIDRRLDIVVQSAIKAGHPGQPDGTLLRADERTIREWYEEWLKVEATIPTPYYVKYEELVGAPRETIDRLAKHLGVPVPLESYPYISDGNSKWG